MAKIKINFGENVQPWDPTKSGVVTLPGGVYATKITGFEEKTNNTTGKNRYEVAMEVTEGEHVGTTVNGAIFGDFSKEGNIKKLKAALAAIGADVSKLNGDKELDLADAFKEGRALHILVKEIEGKDEQGRQKLPEILFIPKSQVDQVKAMQAKTPSKAEAKAETKPKAGGAPLDDLFNQ